MTRLERADTLKKILKIQTQKIEEEFKRSQEASSDTLCSICFTNKVKQGDAETTTLNCSHMFCKACFVASCSVNIDKGEVDQIKCLDFACLTPIQDHDLSVNLTGELFSKY